MERQIKIKKVDDSANGNALLASSSLLNSKAPSSEVIEVVEIDLQVGESDGNGGSNSNSSSGSLTALVYPCKPRMADNSDMPPLDESEIATLDCIAKQIPKSIALPEPHPIWTVPGGNLKYTNANKWQSVPPDKRQECRRYAYTIVPVQSDRTYIVVYISYNQV